MAKTEGESFWQSELGKLLKPFVIAGVALLGIAALV